MPHEAGERTFAFWEAMAVSFAAAIALATLPLVAEALEPTEGYLQQFSLTMPRAKRDQAPLVLDVPEEVKLSSCPVTFGVPFPRGALASEKHMRLLESGREVAAAIRRTAAWEGPDGDIKWVLVDASVQPGRQYTLEYGTEVQPSQHEGGLSVEDEGDEVTVTTGPIRFVVSRKAAGIIHAAWLDDDGDGAFADGEMMVAPGASRAPFMVDDRGAVFQLSAESDYTVTVEQDGPLHAIIKVEGWFWSSEGRKLCQHIARLHAYAGYSFVRVEHTFVVGYDTEKTRLRDIAIPLALNVGPGAEATFGLADGQTAQMTGRGHLVQDAADHFSLKDASGTELASGDRAAGWADVSDGRVGLTLGLRHMWQEYPRELEVREQEIVAHLWPAHHSRSLDFDARAVLGSELYREWDRVYHQNWYENGLDQYDQAYGLAKTNELLLYFHGPDASDGPDLCRTLDEPVIVAPAPMWMCRSGAMGPIHPRDTRRFPEVERKMDAAMTRFEWLREHLGNYGMIDYGDVNYNLALEEENKRWLPRPWRRFASRFYGHPVMPWVQFMRTGERRYLQWGVDNARHVMDIDMCHLTNEELEKYRGGRYGGNGGILHYAGNIYDIGCDSHVDHLLLYYYLTGYRRAWDVLQEEAEFYLWKDTQPGGHLHRYAHRMTGGTMRTMVSLYRATWDERYLKIAQRMAEFCYENQDEEGVVRHDDVYMLPGMLTYHQSTGDERMRELILRCMDYQSRAGRDETDPRSFGFYGLSMAYFMTGDPSYLRWAERWKREFVQCVTEGDDPLWYGQPRGQWDYCYLTLHLLYMPYYLAALASLEQPVEPMVRSEAVTSGPILLRREDEKPFHVLVEWLCYDSRYFSGVAVGCLARYVARRPTEARVVLRGPDGAEAASAAVDMADGRRAGKVSLDARAGPPGTYRVDIQDPGGLHFKLRLASSDLTKVGYGTQGEYLGMADTYYFYVPPEAQKFALSFKTLALRRAVRFAVYDSAGELRKDQEVQFGATPPASYTEWAFDVPPAQRGKLWRFLVTPSHPDVEQTYLRFENVPPIVWTSPEAFFVPDEAAVRPRDWPAPMPKPYPEAGQPRRVEPGKPLTIARGAALGAGRYEKIDAQQGTIELWFRPEWPLDDISDRTIARSGQMRLYRRSRLGTYFSLGGIRQSGVITEPGRWYHLAATWDAGAPGREPERHLFINGIETGAMMSPAKTPLGDWTGDTLRIGGEVAFTIDDLRISDVVRYHTDFDPPTPPARDEHTLLLETF